MKRLKRLESIVRAELTENEASRKSDTALLLGCFARMGIDTRRPFADLAVDGSLRQMETITRVRRRVQADSPELRDGTVTRFRAERQETFREYARTKQEGGNTDDKRKLAESPDGNLRQRAKDEP